MQESPSIVLDDFLHSSMSGAEPLSETLDAMALGEVISRTRVIKEHLTLKEVISDLVPLRQAYGMRFSKPINRSQERTGFKFNRRLSVSWDDETGLLLTVRIVRTA